MTITSDTSTSFTVKFKPYISLEPAYALFLLSFELSELVRTNLYLQKICRHQMDFEPDLTTPCDDERAGIDFVAAVNSKSLFMANIIGTALVVLLTARSDKSNGGRKFSLLCPMVLKTVQLSSMCLQSYFWSWSVWFAALTEGLCNFGIIMKVASMVYVCSISTNKQRIFRMTLLNVINIFCSIVSSGSSGFLLRNLGFLKTYMLCTVLALASVVHVVIFLEDTGTQSQQQEGGCFKNLCEFFSPSSLVDAFKVFFKKGKGKEKAVIYLLSVISILTWSSLSGEATVLYLYLRYKFGWNEEDYGLYYLYKLAGFNIGNIICLGISKYLKMTDYALGTFASFWSVLAALGYIFAYQNWHLFFLPLIDIFRSFTINSCDSLQTKFFESHEFGRMFSVHETLNIAISLCFPAYNLLFQRTMDFAPSAIFALSLSINLSSFILFWICYILMKTSSKKS